MEIKYSGEIIDFLSVETLEKIDYGVLDLSDIKNYELREVLYSYGELLEMELHYNYLNNSTGIFRVSVSHERFYYCESDIVLEADSLDELRHLVLSQKRIWYVFDCMLFENLKEVEKQIKGGI